MAHSLLSLEAPDTRPIIGKVCEYIHCKKDYSCRNPRQKFCSQSCCRKEKRMKKGRWVYTGEVIKCKGCEKEFVKTKAQKIYCTIACSMIYITRDYYQNNKEKWRTPEAKLRYINNSPYKKHKKDSCELCGFIPVHKCQLDVDHVDGNHDNHELYNLQTLCANCHRLKTFLNRDGAYRPTKILKICTAS